jgi:hypothetical protein
MKASTANVASPATPTLVMAHSFTENFIRFNMFTVSFAFRASFQAGFLSQTKFPESGQKRVPKRIFFHIGKNRQKR